MARPRIPEEQKISHQPGRINFKQPVPAKTAIPAMPAHLSAGAKKIWPEVCATILAIGVLSAEDWLAVEGLCECYAELKAARAALKARGSLTYESNGNIRLCPEVNIVRDTDRRFRTWLMAFGLSPQDRSRVTVIPQAAEDFSEFVN